jgi:hypothetical protein
MSDRAPRPSRNARLGLLAAGIVVVALLVVAVPRSGGGAAPAQTPTQVATQVPAAAAPSSSPTPGVSTTEGGDTGVAPGSGEVGPSPTVTSTEAPSATAGLIALIDGLTVAPEHTGGYSRDLFHHWIDADGDGCNTRYEVLIAEAVVTPAVEAGCWLQGGRWVSPYDGRVFTDPSKLDIDHVVALAEAWASGAWEWTPERREAYANDLDVPWALAAVSAASNRSKSDLEPGAWMPPLASDRCDFLVAWVAVKARWSLAVDPAERRDLLGLSQPCAGTPVPAILAP